MKAQKYTIRGTEINKLQFSEIECYLEEKGMNVNEVFAQIADENEIIYVSNGFIRGLKEENEAGEWHHYFKKDADGNFDAGKLKFQP